MYQLSGTTLFSIDRMPSLPENHGEVVSEPITRLPKQVQDKIDRLIIENKWRLTEN